MKPLRDNLRAEDYFQLLLTQRHRAQAREAACWVWVAGVAGVLNFAAMIYVVRMVLEG